MRKRKDRLRGGLAFAPFIAGWAGAYVLAMFGSMMLLGILHRAAELRTLLTDMNSLIFMGVLASLQFLWLRRSLGINLRAWIPLAVLGVIAGEFACQLLEAYVAHPFPPKIYSGSSMMRMPEPEHIMQLKYALYIMVRSFLIWSTPLIFQWAQLRKRFQLHGLWLLAALVHAPLTFVVFENGGVFTHTLKLLDKFTEMSLMRDLQPLGSILYVIDWATPAAVMGVVFYWIVMQDRRNKAAHFFATY